MHSNAVPVLFRTGFYLVLSGTFLLCPADVAIGASLHAVADVLHATQLASAATADRAELASAPPAVRYFDARANGVDVHLSWSVMTDDDIAGFSIRRRDEGECCFDLVDVQGLIPAWQWTHVDPNLHKDTTYVYMLTVVFRNGREAFSRAVPVTTGSRDTHTIKASLAP